MALTDVRLPLQALGAAAATRLIDAIDGRNAMYDSLITDPSPEIVLRSSTGPPGT